MKNQVKQSMKIKSENQYLSFYGHLKVKKRSKQGKKTKIKKYYFYHI